MDGVVKFQTPNGDEMVIFAGSLTITNLVEAAEMAEDVAAVG